MEFFLLQKLVSFRGHFQVNLPTEETRAFVVLPTASKESVISRTLCGCSLISTWDFVKTMSTAIMKTKGPMYTEKHEKT